MEDFEKAAENNETHTAWENTESHFSGYDANIPGPTKYDKAYRSYESTEHSKETQPSKAGGKQGFAVAALILGIVSALFIFIPILGWVGGIATGIVGIVLGVLGRKSSKRGMAIVGLILSAVALGICLLLILWFFTVLAAALFGYIGNKIPSNYDYFFRSLLPYLMD